MPADTPGRFNFSGCAFLIVVVTGGGLVAFVTGWVVGLGEEECLDNTTTLTHVSPPVTLVPLLDRGLSPPSFWGRSVALYDYLASLGKRPLFKGCFRLFPFHTAPVFRCVVAPTDTALGLRWAVWTITREVKSTIRDAPRSVSAFCFGCISQDPLVQRTSPPSL
jgi:hypothetical protein